MKDTFEIDGKERRLSVEDYRDLQPTELAQVIAHLKRALATFRLKKVVTLSGLFSLLIASLAWAQTAQPQRAMYATKAEVRAYPGLSRVFVVVPNLATSGLRTQETFAKDPNDSTSPESDSVIVAAGGVRFKRVSPTTSVTIASAAWGDITGKPSTFTPAAHNQAISTVTGLQDSLNTRQKTITAGTTSQYYRGDKTFQTLDKAAVGLGNLQNVDQTNASNLTSGTIAAGRFGSLTVPASALSQSSATTGQVLKWNGSAWAAAADASGGASTWGGLSGTLSSQTDLQAALDAKAATTRNITAGTGLTGGGSLAADRTISIANDGVTNSKLDNMAQRTIKGRADGAGTGDPTDIDMLALPVSTATQTEITKRIAHKTISEVRAFTATDVTNNPAVFITDTGKEGEFRYVAGSTKSDNTGTVLVSGSYRYERVVKDNTYRADWFKISGDAHTGLAIRRAVNVAIAALATDSNAVVTIGKGRNTVDTTVILTAVPKWKRLIIQGEPGNIIDFYAPESGSAVFSNSASWTYADSSYSGGVVELKGINFYGGRNPSYSAGNASYGCRPILYRNMQGVVIDGCSFRAIYGSGLAIGASRSVIVRGNTFENVYARQANSPDATGDAMSIYAYVRNLVVSGNIMQVQNGLTGRCGISVDDRTRNFTVSDNIVQGYERGIHIEHCLAGVISGNVVSRSAFAGMSSINRSVIWANNIFDGDKQTAADLLGYPGLFTTLNDTLCAYRGNTFRNWSGRSNTYLAKFWCHDSVIENNTFEPNKANAQVYGYGYNYRNTYRNNEFRGGVQLLVHYNYNPTVVGNTFWGGTVETHNSEDAIVMNNIVQPNVGSNTGSGLLIYNCLRPYVSGNTIINAASYVIEQSLTTDGVFENNTYLRKHSSAVAYSTFFVSTGISATGAKKTAPDRYNVIRDYVSTAGTYYVGNTGTPTAY